MENWGKRAAILIAFSLVLGILLVLIKGIGSSERPAPPTLKPEKLDISTTEPSAPVEKKTPPPRSPSTAPAPRPVSPPPAAPTGPGAPPNLAPTSEMPADLSEKLRTEARRESAFRSLFSSKEPEANGTIDRGKIEQSVYEYVDQYCQELNLSERDRQHLVDLVEDFREANLKVRVASGSGINSPDLKQYVKEMNASMNEFRKMTTGPSETLFGDRPPMIPFGD